MVRTDKPGNKTVQPLKPLDYNPYDNKNQTSLTDLPIETGSRLVRRVRVSDKDNNEEDGVDINKAAAQPRGNPQV
jgi:hypothetical protein